MWPKSAKPASPAAHPPVPDNVNPLSDDAGLAAVADDRPAGSAAAARDDDAAGPARLYQLDPDSPVPLYLQLAASLKQRITSGELSGRMPSENVIAARYGVSRRIVRDALMSLRHDGIVQSAQGLGTFVIARPEP